MLREFVAALSFLTRFPVPGAATVNGTEVARSARVFPLVGALLGVIAGACVGITSSLPPLVSAALTVAVLARITGALHLDAIADMADGFGGGVTPGRVVLIMRDHCVGAYGAATLIFNVLLKVVALAALIETGDAFMWLVSAGALSRLSTVVLGASCPYAAVAKTGTAVVFTELLGRREIIGACVATVAVCLLTLGRSFLPAVLVAAIVALVVSRWSMRRIGGVTGDVLGACTEATETLILVAATSG